MSKCSGHRTGVPPSSRSVASANAYHRASAPAAASSSSSGASSSSAATSPATTRPPAGSDVNRLRAGATSSSATRCSACTVLANSSGRGFRARSMAPWSRVAPGRYAPTVPRDDAQVLELAGREVRITSPDRVLFAKAGVTKLDLVRYYAALDEPLMRAMGGRPVLMQRFPRGAGGPSFFQKRVPDGAPDWLETTTVQTVNGTPSRALVAADVAHVAWAVNLACLGFHVWPHRADDPDHADELRLDLDPQPGTSFPDARAAAVELKALL